MVVFPFILGVLMVVSVLGDQMNTLVSSHTANHKWWLSRRLTNGFWSLLRWLAAELPEGRLREGLLALYPPLLILILLIAWVSQQVVGFALIWWSLGGVDGAVGFLDYTYYSGVVFFRSDSVRSFLSTCCPVSVLSWKHSAASSLLRLSSHTCLLSTTPTASGNASS